MAKRNSKTKTRASRKSSKGRAAVPSAIDRSWEAEEDLRTLKRTAEIKADKPRLARAQKEADKQTAAIEKAKKA